MKRYVALALVAIMLMSQVAIYGVTDEEAYAGSQLHTLGILKGRSDGGLALESNISRAEVATMTVRILGYEDALVLGEGKEFTDVDPGYWAFEYIQNAYKLQVIKGYPSGEFKPVNDIAYAEVVAIMVNALGKQHDMEGGWPDNYLNTAKSLGIIPSDSEVDPTKIITRGEMAVIVWDTLLVKD